MDGTDQIAPDDTDLLSDAAVTRLRAHPRFREAVAAWAANDLGKYESEDAVTRRLLSDMGRAGLYLGAVLLDDLPGGLTFAGLAQMALSNKVCSRGRVLAFVQYAQATGRLTIPTGPEPWSRRRMSLSPTFVDPLRARFAGVLRATSVVAPDVTAALPQLSSNEMIRKVVATVGTLLAVRPELNRNPGGALRQIFLARDAGARLLNHMILQQAPGRSRLMEEAPISRAEFSRRYGVSRTHVNRLLAEAEAMGALSVVSSSRVIFSPAFSDEAEAYFAGLMQVNRTVVAMMVAAPA